MFKFPSKMQIKVLTIKHVKMLAVNFVNISKKYFAEVIKNLDLGDICIVIATVKL